MCVCVCTQHFRRRLRHKRGFRLIPNISFALLYYSLGRHRRRMRDCPVDRSRNQKSQHGINMSTTSGITPRFPRLNGQQAAHHFALSLSYHNIMLPTVCNGSMIYAALHAGLNELAFSPIKLWWYAVVVVRARSGSSIYSGTCQALRRTSLHESLQEDKDHQIDGRPQEAASEHEEEYIYKINGRDVQLRTRICPHRTSR